MTGLEQFLTLFGNMTVSTIVVIVLALFFCWKTYKQITKFLENKKNIAIQKHEAEKEKDEQLNLVLAEVKKYPQYREQSIQIQKAFRTEIDELKSSQILLAEKQEKIQHTLNTMKETSDKRDRNNLRDRLLQMYRHYTNEKTNSSHSWTRMESEVFWELFNDYEEAGGDGFMHTIVQPAMNSLEIIDN